MIGKADNYLILATKISILGLAFIGFVIYPNVLYPDVFTKGLFTRFFISAALVGFAWLLLKGLVRFPRATMLGWAIMAYALALILSMFLGTSVFRSFWGEAQRMDGVFAFLHYTALFFIARALFSKKDWLTYFKLVVAGTPFLVLYAILQYIGSRFSLSLPMVYSPSTQPGSLFGNPAFFSAFLLFSAGFSGFIFYLEKNKKWRQFALGVAALSVLVILWLGVRGAAIGAFLGLVIFLCFLAFSRGSGKGKKISRIILFFGGLALVAMLALSPFISSYYPNLVKRIINLPNEPSFITRSLALQSSAKAWMDSPRTFLVGWGPEQFIVGYNKYYNPEHGTYEDSWFDRAHNKIADVFVMTGLLGLIAYLAVFFAAGRYLFRLATSDEYRHVSFVASALLVGYFAANLTFFDLPQTYINFFLLLAFIDAIAKGDLEKNTLGGGGGMSSLRIGTGAAISVGVLAIIIFTIIFPLYQSNRYMYYFRSHNGNELYQNLDSIFKPHNYAHYSLIDDFWRRLESQGSFRDWRYVPMADYVIEEIKRELKLEPLDATMFLRLATIYTERGIGNGKDVIALKAGEEYSRKAIALSPGRQELYYMLAFSLQGQKRYADAVQVMKEAVALNPKAKKARYNLGLNLALAGDLKGSMDEIEGVRKEGWFPTFQEKDARNIISIYTAAKENDLLLELYKDFLKNRILKDKEYFIIVIKDAITRKDKDEAEFWVGRYGDTYPEYRSELACVISVLEEGKWELLGALPNLPKNLCGSFQ